MDSMKIVRPNKENRLRNLRLLTDEFDVKGVADKLGLKSATYLYQILSPNVDANVGDSIAQRLEHAFKLPPGWMDQDNKYLPWKEPKEPPPPFSGEGGSLHGDLLVKVVDCVEKALVSENITISGYKKGLIVRHVYLYYEALGRSEPDMPTVIEFVRLAA